MEGKRSLEVPALREAYAGWKWDVAWRWAPHTITYRLSHPDGDVRYLKVAESSWHPRIADEAARMRWASRYLPVPEVLDSGGDRQVEWLVTRAVPGSDATDERLLAQAANLVEILGRGLRLFHSAPVSQCPFDFRLDVALEHVRQRVDAGLINPDRDFHSEHKHLKVAEALAALEEDRPPVDELVVCHGDYCFPNMVIQDQQVVGFLDLGELGVADRWWDLAAATWSTTWNLGPGWENAFLEAYEIEPDHDRIAYYRLLYDLAS
jgi:kanamycin kinase